MTDDSLFDDVCVAIAIVVSLLVIFYGSDLIRDILNWIVQHCPWLFLFGLFVLLVVLASVSVFPRIGILRRVAS